jgi:hypothetical protein
MNALIQSRDASRYQNWDNLINIVSNLWWTDEVFLAKSQELQLKVEEALMDTQVERTLFREKD